MSITATRAEVGPMVTGGDVEAAVMVVLRDWLPAYLAEGERQHSLPPGEIPIPKGWAITGRDLRKLNTDQLPCIVVMAWRGSCHHRSRKAHPVPTRRCGASTSGRCSQRRGAARRGAQRSCTPAPSTCASSSAR